MILNHILCIGYEANKQIYKDLNDENKNTIIIVILNTTTMNIRKMRQQK